MGNIEQSLTFYLFANPSFMKGLGRLGDFNGGLNDYNNSETEEEADTKALRHDFIMIAKDMTQAAKRYEREHSK